MDEGELLNIKIKNFYNMAKKDFSKLKIVVISEKMDRFDGIKN